MHFNHQNTPDKMIAKLSNEVLQESILAGYAIYHHIHDLYMLSLRSGIAILKYLNSEIR